MMFVGAMVNRIAALELDLDSKRATQDVEIGSRLAIAASLAPCISRSHV
jgi:hypothetical protein